MDKNKFVTEFNCDFGMVEFAIVWFAEVYFVEMRLLGLVVYANFLSSLVGVARFRMSLCCSGFAVTAAVHGQVGVAGFWMREALLRVVFVVEGWGCLSGSGLRLGRFRDNKIIIQI